MTNGNINTLLWDVQENTLQITTTDGTVYTLTNPKLSNVPNEDTSPEMSTDAIDDQNPELVAHLLEEYYKPKSGEDVGEGMLTKNRKILTGDSVIVEAMANISHNKLRDKINAMPTIPVSYKTVVPSSKEHCTIP